MIQIPCADGFLLHGECFKATGKARKNKALIINSATAVDSRLYRNYALYMAQEGFDVITYDYRGIAHSRPKKLCGFKASFTDWGELDLLAIINYIRTTFPKHKLLVLGHSKGGTIIGMCPLNSLIAGTINIGAQTAYYKDWSFQRIPKSAFRNYQRLYEKHEERDKGDNPVYLIAMKTVNAGCFVHVFLI